MMINTEFWSKWQIALTVVTVCATLVQLWRAAGKKEEKGLECGIGETCGTKQFKQQRSDSQKFNSFQHEGVVGKGERAPQYIITSLPLECPVGRLGGSLAYTENTENCDHKNQQLDLWGGERRLYGNITTECDEDVVLNLNQAQVGRMWTSVSNSNKNIRDCVKINKRGPSNMSWGAVASNKLAIVVYGGRNDRTKWSDEIWIRKTRESEWRRGLVGKGSEHPPALIGAAATLLSSEDEANGVRFLLCGGKGMRGVYSDVWLCTIPSYPSSDNLKEDDQSLSMTTCDVHWEKLWSPTSEVTSPSKSGKTECLRPIPRYRHSCVTTEDHLILIGGCDASGRHINGEVVEAFSFQYKTWTRRKPRINKGEVPLIGPGLCTYSLPFVANQDDGSGKNARKFILVVSGDSAGIFNSICLLDEAMSEWTRVEIIWGGDWTMIPGVRYGFCSTMATDGTLYVFGGPPLPSLDKSSRGQLLAIYCQDLLLS